MLAMWSEKPLRVARGNLTTDIVFAELVQPFDRGLRELAERLLGSRLRPYLDSDDLLQEVYLVLWSGLRTRKIHLTTIGRLQGLLRVLMRRRVARHWRAIRRIDEARAVDLDAQVCVLPMSKCSEDAEPSRRLVSTETIREVLARFHGADRRFLTLLSKGFTIAAAARQLKLDAGYLRQRLVRIRVRLKTATRAAPSRSTTKKV
jgi:DNA-directed RNA polymerase specialized sigma24 family protein